MGPREVYTDHMPGEPASARCQSLPESAGRGVPTTRDGVFLGSHHALTATHSVTANQFVLGGQQNLIAVDDGAASGSARCC